MLEPQKTQTTKILIKATGRLFLTDPKDICYATIEDGVITVATSGHAGMEGHSNCRTLEELFENSTQSVLAGAPVFPGEHQSHSRSRALVQELYQLRMDDKKQTEIPVSRAQTRRFRELFNL